MTTATSMYERVGGGPAVRLVVHKLYQLILADDQLQPYFQGVSLERLEGHMADLIAQTLGGPESYTGGELAVVHADLKITGAHYDRVADYVAAALLIAHAPRDIVAAVGDVLGGLKDQIVAA